MSRKKTLTALIILISGNITLVQGDNTNKDSNGAATEIYEYESQIYDDECPDYENELNSNEEGAYFGNNKQRFSQNIVSKSQGATEDKTGLEHHDIPHQKQISFLVPLEDSMPSLEEKSIIKSKHFLEYMRKATPAPKVEVTNQDEVPHQLRQNQLDSWRQPNKKKQHNIGHFRPGKKSSLDYLHIKSNTSVLDQYQKKMKPILTIDAENFNEKLFRRLSGIHEKEKIPQCSLIGEEMQKNTGEETNEIDHKVERRAWDIQGLMQAKKQVGVDADQINKIRAKWRLRPSSGPFGGNLNWGLSGNHDSYKTYLHVTSVPNAIAYFKDDAILEKEKPEEHHQETEMQYVINNSNGIVENKTDSFSRQKRLIQKHFLENDEQSQRMALYNNNLNFENIKNGNINNLHQTVKLNTKENENEKNQLKGKIELREIKKENCNYKEIRKSNDLFSGSMNVRKRSNEIKSSNSAATANKIEPNKIHFVNVIGEKVNGIGPVNSYRESDIERERIQPLQYIHPLAPLPFATLPNDSYFLYEPFKFQHNMFAPNVPFPVPAMFPPNMYPPHIQEQILASSPINATSHLIPQREPFNIVGPNESIVHDVITISIDPRTLTNKILHAEFINKTEENKDLNMGKSSTKRHEESASIKITEPNETSLNYDSNVIKIAPVQGTLLRKSKQTDDRSILQSESQYKSLPNNKRGGIVGFFAKHKILPRNIDEESNSVEENPDYESMGISRSGKDSDQNVSFFGNAGRNYGSKLMLNSSDDDELTKVVVIQAKQKNPAECPADKECNRVDCSLFPIGGTGLCQRTTLCMADFKEIHEGKKKRSLDSIRLKPYKINPLWIKECSTRKDINICGNPCLGKRRIINKRDLNENLLNIIKPVILLKPEEDEAEDELSSREILSSLDKGNKKMENKILEGFINSIISNYSRGEIKSEAKKNSETTTSDKEALESKEMSKIVKQILRRGDDIPDEWGVEPIIIPEESLSAFQNNDEYAKIGPFDERVIRSLLESKPIKIIGKG